MTTNRKWRAGLAAAIAAVTVGGWGTTAWGASADAGTSNSAGAGAHSHNIPAAVTPQPCGTVTGPFHVSGDQVLNASGVPFVSYGMTVGGLQQSAWPTLTTIDDQRIDAAAQYWCVNTIRLQIQQDYLVGVGSTPPQAGYLTAIEGEVARAESHHMVVVLNDQTEGNTSGSENLPSAGTLSFWHQLDAVYKNDPQVVLDIFNEPRSQSTSREPADCAAQDWEWWQHGNTAIATGNLGLQEVVDSVRGDGAANLIWAEGPCWAGTLAHVMQYPLTDPAHKLVYDFHHPQGAASSPHTATEWNADFGYLISGGLAPVVDGEWTNRSSGTSTNCWADAPTAVPAYLSYLSDKGIGLVGFQLVNGFLLKSDNLDDPSIIDSRWQCGDAAIDEGAGQQLMDWFQLHNGIFAGS